MCKYLTGICGTLTFCFHPSFLRLKRLNNNNKRLVLHTNTVTYWNNVMYCMYDSFFYFIWAPIILMSHRTYCSAHDEEYIIYKKISYNPLNSSNTYYIIMSTYTHNNISHWQFSSFGGKWVIEAYWGCVNFLYMGVQ